MSAFTTGVFARALTDLIGIGVTLNPDGSLLAITGPTIERVTAAPVAVRNGGSLALRNNGTAYITAGGGVWFALGGVGTGFHLPDDVLGAWGTAAPGQVGSVYVSAANRYDLSGAGVTDAVAGQGPALRFETGINVITGAAVGTGSNAIEIRTGATDSTNAGGTAGPSADLTISTGASTATLGTSGNTGNLNFTTGASTSANSGNMVFTIGAAGGVQGVFRFVGPTFDTTAQATTWNMRNNSATALVFQPGAGVGPVGPMLTFNSTAAFQVEATARFTTTDGVAGGTVRVVGGLAYRTVADSATITNTTVETAFSTGVYTVPANTMKVGTQIHVRAWGVAPSTNAIDTLTIALRFGAAGVAAQIVSQTAAVDVANGDTFVVDAVISIRTTGTGGTMVASTQWVLGVPDTATGRADRMASSAIDTTIARDLTLTADWSAANTANQVILEGMSVWID